MESSITGFMLGAKKMKGPGIDLISTIYEFWMKMFKDFTNEIWKHSSKFTLNFFKKDPLEQRDDCDSNL